MNLDDALTSNNDEYLLQLLQDKTIAIEDVKKIYFANRENKKIVAQTAMNLSLRTSVYDRDKEYSDTMLELLKDIANNPIDMQARWTVAKNPHTPMETLDQLAGDKVNLVRALVATNPSTPSKILENFFHDEKIVRDGLAGNPNTPVKILYLLSNESDKMVRMRLAENSSLPIEILELLLDDVEEDVVNAAKSHLQARKERSL